MSAGEVQPARGPQTAGSQTQTPGEGSGSAGSFPERQGRTAPAVGREAGAEDRARSEFAWATQTSREAEVAPTVAEAGETTRQAARVELKELPQFVRKAEVVALAGGSTEMRVQLVPENLGRLSVRISVSEGAVSARLVVENPQVKALVEERLPELERALREQGLHLNGLSVGCENAGTRDGAFPREQLAEWSGRDLTYGSARREYDEHPLGVAPPVPEGLRHLWTGQGGLLDALV
jgi:flagellar hook-length control protein FliK